jgi:hypothetical protein
MLFPVLFYLQTQLIFAMPGIGFRTLSYIFAAAVAFALPLLVSLLKFILTDKELRLETYFITNLFICLLGLIATVNGNIAYSAVNTHVEIKGVLLSAGIFLIFFAMGFLINKYKYKMGIRYK